MKFGVITYARKALINIGDNVMSLGIRNIYRKMGIKEDDIVNIYVSRESDAYIQDSYLNEMGVDNQEYNLDTYDGDEYILLPMASHMELDFIREKWFPLPHKIIPVFIGIHCISPDGAQQYLQEYKHLGPIGCRDVMTMENLRKAGLDAYTLGCLSIQAVDRREETEEQNKVFLVDIPEQLRKYIPKELLENAVNVTHDRKIEGNINAKERAKIENEMLLKQLEEYRKYAKLVVTNRLHCTLPCIAMGIPTITVKTTEIDKYKDVSVFDNRYSRLDKFMNIYEKNEFDKIDWNPPKPNIEEFKEKQLRQAIRMISDVYEKYNELTEISSFFERNPRSNYFSSALSGYLSRKQQENFYAGKTKYKTILELIMNRHLYETHLIIYGAGDKGKWMYTKLRDEINMARSCIYVDNNPEKQGKKLWGINILSPNVIEKYTGKYVVVVACNHSYDRIAQEIAKSLTTKYLLVEGRDYFMLDKIIESDSMALSRVSASFSYNWDKIWD